jgi:hypothetical protein
MIPAVLVTGGTASSAATTVSGSGTAALIATANSSSTAFTVPTPTVGTIVVKTYAFTNGVQAPTSTSSLTITVAAAATSPANTFSAYQTKFGTPVVGKIIFFNSFYRNRKEMFGFVRNVVF